MNITVKLLQAPMPLESDTDRYHRLLESALSRDTGLNHFVYNREENIFWSTMRFEIGAEELCSEVRMTALEVQFTKNLDEYVKSKHRASITKFISESLGL